MHFHQKILKGTSFLSLSEIINQGCALIRNIILARFLSKADFGIAALLGMVLTFFEFSGKIALNQQVIQSKHGDEPGFVRSVQFTQFCAGTVSALLILVAAWPLAHFKSSSQSLLACIMALALIPFFNGLVNLDVYRYTRHLHYGPQVLTDSVPQVITTLVAWPLAAWLKDYRAVLVILLGKAVLSATMTHLLAERRYSVQFERMWFRESMKFGWPLLVTGFVQFGNFQGDSMVVAAAYPLAQLGSYSVALTMAMTPGFAILRIASSLGLPLLSEVQNDAQRFAARYGQFVQAVALIGCLMTLGMLFCGQEAVRLLFGAKYTDVGALACWLTGAQAMRILRGSAVIASMARGDTVNNLFSSAWRLSGLLLAIVVGLFKANITWFAITALTGEMVALSVTIIRLKTKHYIAVKMSIMPIILAVVNVLVGVAVRQFFSIGAYSFLNWLLLPVALVLSVGAFLVCFRGLRGRVAESALHFMTGFGWEMSKGNREVMCEVPALGAEIEE